MSKIDLENDFLEELSVPILAALEQNDKQKAIDYLQKKKALRMGELLKKLKQEDFKGLISGDLIKPLTHLIKIIEGE